MRSFNCKEQLQRVKDKREATLARAYHAYLGPKGVTMTTYDFPPEEPSSVELWVGFIACVILGSVLAMIITTR